jgi:hypothetical protein
VTQGSLHVFSLLVQETRMWAVIIVQREIYLSKYSHLQNTTLINQINFTSHNHHCLSPCLSFKQRKQIQSPLCCRV